MEREVVTIINPASGRDEPVLAALSDAFGRADLRWEPRVTTGEGDARRFAEEAREAGAERVVVYGGDGTVSAVASALVDAETELAILPGGTGNAFAQEIGVPGELEAAIALALDPSAESRAYDCLGLGERCFLLRVGIGADARVMEQADRERKDRLGWLAYLISALEQLRDPRPASYTLELDGERLELDAVSVVLANVGRIGRGNLRIAEDIDPTDGWMDVFAIRDVRATTLASLGASALGIRPISEGLGSVEAEPVRRWRARRASVSASPERGIHGDGETLGSTPLDVRVLPGALRVVTPPA